MALARQSIQASARPVPCPTKAVRASESSTALSP